MTKTYLGDGVYVELDEVGAVVLTTENGIAVTNRIVLEPEVLESLELWFERRYAEAIQRSASRIEKALTKNAPTGRRFTR